ncbi:MAG: ferritin family protein [Deltaproteobacteria bacterium]|nr:ferritin family protein [Deltaproteobacteria bacterium]
MTERKKSHKIKIAKGLTPVEIIGIGITKEINSEAFYRAFAKRVTNRVVKKRILNIAEEEAEHREMLKGIFSEMTGEKGITPNRYMQKKPVITEKILKLSHQEILKKAIDMEDESIRLYQEGYRYVKSESVRKILSYLIDFEKGHKETLTQELRLLTKEPDWFDTAGSSEWLGQMFMGP